MSIINELEDLIKEGEMLRPLGGDVFNGYNGRKQPEYLSWRLQVINTIENLGRDSKIFLKEIEKDKNSAYFYETSVANILGILKGALSVAKKRDHSIVENLKNTKEVKDNIVFIVHGRNDTILQNIARFLEKIDIKPIILFEQAGKGQTVIEKLENHSNVGYAIVLLTPDDIGKFATEDNLKPRARQNVILELGYFIGKLRRNFVGVLYDESVELPSDYRGVEYIKLDAEGAWRLKLAKEMKVAGLNIDMNKII